MGSGKPRVLRRRLRGWRSSPPGRRRVGKPERCRRHPAPAWRGRALTRDGGGAIPYKPAYVPPIGLVPACGAVPAAVAVDRRAAPWRASGPSNRHSRHGVGLFGRFRIARDAAFRAGARVDDGGCLLLGLPRVRPCPLARCDAALDRGRVCAGDGDADRGTDPCAVSAGLAAATTGATGRRLTDSFTPSGPGSSLPAAMAPQTLFSGTD